MEGRAFDGEQRLRAAAAREAELERREAQLHRHEDELAEREQSIATETETVAQARRTLTDVFRQAELDSPELDARLLTYRGVHPDDVPFLINASNAVVVPSEREGFGLGPLEALACNVPVAATDVGVAPIALAGVPAALCAPFDLARWTAALRPHVERADPRIEGRAHAALFERGRLAERVAAAYRELLSSPL